MLRGDRRFRPSVCRIPQCSFFSCCEGIDAFVQPYSGSLSALSSHAVMGDAFGQAHMTPQCSLLMLRGDRRFRPSVCRIPQCSFFSCCDGRRFRLSVCRIPYPVLSLLMLRGDRRFRPSVYWIPTQCFSAHAVMGDAFALRCCGGSGQGSGMRGRKG